MATDTTVSPPDIVYTPGWLDKQECTLTLSKLKEQIDFYRVKYVSERFKKECETPCWTAAFTRGPWLSKLKPFHDFPPVLTELASRVSKVTGKEYNVALVRLYASGKDQIAWHTDARAFLGTPTSVASVSLGASRIFEMRAPKELWGRYTPWRSDLYQWTLKDGDLFEMKGRSQDYYVHRVDKTASASPRMNINFRYIPDTPLAIDGVTTYYKYCVGDGESKKYKDIVKGTLEGFFQPSGSKRKRTEAG